MGRIGRSINRLCMVPVALVEAVLCGCMMGLECFLDFWNDGHKPFE